MDIPDSLSSMLAGEHGPTKQKAQGWSLTSLNRRRERVRHVRARARQRSVAPTGGHGLRRFLADLAEMNRGVAIPTTLNSAGCDKEKMQEMDIEVEDFLKHQFEIVHAYAELGIEATLSCTPYDRGIENQGIGSWLKVMQWPSPTLTPHWLPIARVGCLHSPPH